jgi:hypothetical protein
MPHEQGEIVLAATDMSHRGPPPTAEHEAKQRAMGRRRAHRTAWS